MQINVTIEEASVVDAMVEDGSFAMNLLAGLAERKGAIEEICTGDCGSTWHSSVAPFLRKLADALDANT